MIHLCVRVWVWSKGGSGLVCGHMTTELKKNVLTSDCLKEFKVQRNDEVSKGQKCDDMPVILTDRGKWRC